MDRPSPMVLATFAAGTRHYDVIADGADVVLVVDGRDTAFRGSPNDARTAAALLERAAQTIDGAGWQAGRRII